MLIRVPLPRQGIQYERSESFSDLAQEAINLWHQEIREVALPHVAAGLEPIPRAHLILELCYGAPRQDGFYRPQSLGEAHRLVTHAIRGLIQAGVLVGDASMSATRETVTRAVVKWHCASDAACRELWPEEGIWIAAPE